MRAKLLQSFPTLCDPKDCSLLGSSIHGISQLRKLELVAMPSSRGSSQPRDPTQSLKSPALAGRFFTTKEAWEAPVPNKTPPGVDPDSPRPFFSPLASAFQKLPPCMYPVVGRRWKWGWKGGHPCPTSTPTSRSLGQRDMNMMELGAGSQGGCLAEDRASFSAAEYGPI